MTDWIDYGRFQTRSPRMHALLAEAEKAAVKTASVFIQGEAGTGRRTLARWIHEKSTFRSGRFVLWNPNHELRLQEADTVLVENIQEASVPDLMRLRQNVDDYAPALGTRVRWIVTMQGEGQRWIESSSVARDLAYRLRLMTLQVPRIQDRREDIADLSLLFLRVCCLVNGFAEKSLSPSAQRFLENHNWVGHVAELNNAIERATLCAEGSLLGEQDFSFLRTSKQPTDTLQLAQAGLSLSEMEKKLIFQTLEMTRQNKTRAAQLLGISIRTLRNKLNLYRGGGADVEHHV